MKERKNRYGHPPSSACSFSGAAKGIGAPPLFSWKSVSMMPVGFQIESLPPLKMSTFLATKLQVIDVLADVDSFFVSLLGA